MLLIVDVLNQLYRNFYGMPPLATSAGVPTGAIFGLAKNMLAWRARFKPTHMIAISDFRGKNFRHDLYPLYKSNRSPAPPEFHSQLPFAGETLEALGIPAIAVPGVEADDVVASAAKMGAKYGLPVLMCSSDKDLMQLVSCQIQIYDGLKDRIIGPAEVFEKFGVEPRLVGEVLALAGDTSDNVPGATGIGPKTAAKLVLQYGSALKVIEAAQDGLIPGKRGGTLAQEAQQVHLSHELVKLRDVPLPADFLDRIRVRDPDPTIFKSYCDKYEFRELT